MPEPAVDAEEPAVTGGGNGVEQAIQALFAPSSVAIVGASEQSHWASNAYRRLQRVGYPGGIQLVHRSARPAFGRSTVRSLRDLSERPDVAYIAVPAAAVPDVVDDCVTTGVPAAIVVSTGFAESGPEGARLLDRMERRARGAGMALCGPGAIGVMNLHNRVEVFGGRLETVANPGALSLVSQSGALLHSVIGGATARGIGFSYVVAAGMATVLDVNDFLEHMVADPCTRAVALVVEVIPDAERFMAAAARLRAAGKAVVCLRVGRSAAGTRAVVGHTGALVGRREFYDELFAAAGVPQAVDVDDLLDRCVVFHHLPSARWPTGNRLGVVSVSGGVGALFCDLAASEGLELAELGHATEERLAEILPPRAVPSNPLDLAGQAVTSPNDRAGAVAGLLGDPAVDAAVVILGGEQRGAEIEALAALAASAGGPLVIATPSRSTMLSGDARAAVDQGRLAYLGDIGACVRALGAAAQFTRAPRTGPRAAGDTLPPLPAPGASRLSEVAARALLGAFGVYGPRESAVSAVEEAVAAAEAIGYPVVVKALAASIAHRSDLGLVEVGITDAEGVGRSASRIFDLQKGLLGLSSPLVLVQQMVPPGVEVLLGVLTEDGFPPLVVVGRGGVHAELETARAVRFAPVDPVEAAEMLAELPLGRVLEGYRGAPALDVEAIVAVMVGVSRFAVAAQDWLLEAELNPVIVLGDGHGCVAVDALVTARG